MPDDLGSLPALELIDRSIDRPVLVIGSLPPQGRDLDLLGHRTEHETLERALAGAGFTHEEDRWWRLAQCTVELVDLIPAEDWGLASQDLAELFASSLAVAGSSRVRRPSPTHAVLILARRLQEDGDLSAKRRARLERALAEDPTALAQARERAERWGASAGMAALESQANGPEHPGRRKGVRTARRLAGRALARLRGHRGAVIALSGLDGAGKSSQAAALRETLQRLGYDVEIEWTRIGWNDRFWAVAVAVKGVLTRVIGPLVSLRSALSRHGSKDPTDAQRSGGSAADLTPAAQQTALREDPIKALRQRSGLLTELWAAVIALDNAWAQRRLTRPHLRAGRIVICDRYILDSVVSLRYLVDEDRHFGLARWLIARISPRPLRAFLLEVTPETAWARKGEHGLHWLEHHHALYREEHAGLGVALMDGERPQADLCADIAREVWGALRR